MPTLHLIGNAQLDPVWLWRWQEGFEIKTSFRLRNVIGEKTNLLEGDLL